MRVSRCAFLLFSTSIYYASVSAGEMPEGDTEQIALDHMLWLTLQSAVHLELALEGAGLSYLKGQVNISEEGAIILHSYAEESSSTLEIYLDKALGELCIKTGEIYSAEILTREIAALDGEYRSTLHQIIDEALANVKPEDRNSLLNYAASQASGVQITKTNHDSIFEGVTDADVPALMDDLCALPDPD